ncbi:YciI family protein [Paenibacillus mesophilus]|uniref:YciI family protein n=1 Tax=Paenibacillus mesophilus TaxID=2582849 RepID=UPI00110D9316|nr:YciI family protein [Paenibacillus mesophilus]TMV43735.1 YciI family protein [Paenibacillus mesophilus]
MRFMMIVKATRHSEAGVGPARELVEAMTAYNEELARAGVLLAAEGLYPSSGGIRITYPVPGGKPKVAPGPFEGARELIAGITLIEVKSEEEAYEWAIRMPDPHGFGEGEIELRRVYEAAELIRDPILRAMEADLRDQIDMLYKK